METIKKINYLLDRKSKIKCIYLIFLIIGGSICDLLGITIIMPIVNLAMSSSDISDNYFAGLLMRVTGVTGKEEVLLVMIGICIIIYIFKNIYLTFMNITLYNFSAETKRRTATRLLTAYLKQPYSFFLKKNSAELIRSINDDVSNFYQVVLNVLFFCANGTTAIAIVICLLTINLSMTLTVAGVMFVCLLLIVFVVQRKLRDYGRGNQKYSGLMVQYIEQAISGVKEIKIINSEKEFIREYSDVCGKQTRCFVGWSILSTLPKYIIEMFAIAAIMGYFGYNILFNSDYSSIMPELAAFVVAAYRLLPATNQTYGNINSIIFYRASIDLVYNDIKQADNFSENFSENRGLYEKIPFNECILVKDVVYSYEGNDRKVLDGVNIRIEKGQSVAMIGPSGGGKTTMADIILSLLSPVSGNVLVDGKDVSENIWGFRSHLGYIPQTIYLTDDTIRRNVAFGIEPGEIDDEKVMNALKGAQLLDFIKTLPEGINTMVGERGARLSGGQRQRIGIARALYRDPDILVFDEATSALDNETEKEVMKAVDSLAGEKTILMIAHRLSTIENCDVVYEVADGKVTRKR